MSNGTKVVKRNGTIQPLNLEKMHVMVEQACENLAGVSASQVEIQSGIQFYDGISTGEIQEILIRSASDLIDLDHPNYQYVAARLLLFSIRKSIFGRIFEMPKVRDHVIESIERGVYDPELIDLYDDEDVDSSYYWSQANDSGWSAPSGQCRNYRGNSSLRGAPKRVLKNPFATDGQPSISGVEVSGISFSQS